MKDIGAVMVKHVTNYGRSYYVAMTPMLANGRPVYDEYNDLVALAGSEDAAVARLGEVVSAWLAVW